MTDDRYLFNPWFETAGPAFSLDLLPTVLNVDPAQMQERGFVEGATRGSRGGEPEQA
jgi:hypothetical protein